MSLPRVSEEAVRGYAAELTRNIGLQGELDQQSGRD
jgi:hypothetical protein